MKDLVVCKKIKDESTFEKDTYFVAPKPDISLDRTTGEKVTQITRWETEACDTTMLRSRLLFCRQPNHWRINEIRSLRTVCFRARRLYQRLRGKPDSDRWEDTHRHLSNRLEETIRKNKKPLRSCTKYVVGSATTRLQVQIKEEMFPTQWKERNLVLLPKCHLETHHHPFWMLDTKGEIMKRVMYSRLLPTVESSNSTVDAIRMWKRQLSFWRLLYRGSIGCKKCIWLGQLELKDCRVFSESGWKLLAQPKHLWDEFMKGR